MFKQKLSRLTVIWIASAAPFAGAAAAQDTPAAASSPGPHRLQNRFDAANTSHDGHLTLSQAQAANMRRVARHFDDIDFGHKGYVTLDDIRQFTRARRTARAGQEPAANHNP